MINKSAFFESYANKDKLKLQLETILTDPKVRLASHAPQILGILGAGTGALAAGYLAPKEEMTDAFIIPGLPAAPKKKKKRRIMSLKAVAMGSMLGGAAGAYAGTAIKDRVKWDKIRSLMNVI